MCIVCVCMCQLQICVSVLCIDFDMRFLICIFGGSLKVFVNNFFRTGGDEESSAIGNKRDCCVKHVS